MSDTTARPVFLNRATPPTVLTLILIASVQAMAMNLFLPSLPAMTEFFATDYAVMQLSVSLFLAVNAAIQLVIGPMSDRFGRRPVILTGVGAFALATVGCIYATNVEVFLFFRMLQAMVVVCMVLSRAMVRDMYDQDKAASMIGYITMGMSIVPMLSPMLGGWIEEHFGWQASFWLLAVVGAALWLLVWVDAGETNRQKSASFSEQFSQYPELFRSPRFWGYSGAAALSSGAFFAYLGGAPFVGSEVFGMSPTRLGLYFGAPALGYLFGNGVTGRMAGRVGINVLVLIGSIIGFFGVLLSILLLVLGVDGPLAFFGPMTLLGLGNGLVIPNATSGLMSVRPRLAGTASGLGGAMMIGGGAILAGLAGGMLSTGTGAYPLLWIMAAVTFGGFLAILLVIRREKRQGLA